VINPKAFSGYLEKGNIASFHPLGHEQYPFDNVGQNQLAHGVLQNTPMWVLLSNKVLVWLCNTFHSVQ
jgi:hypothetical protein